MHQEEAVDESGVKRHRADEILDSIGGCRLLYVCMHAPVQLAMQRAMQAIGKKEYHEVNWCASKRPAKNIIGAINSFKPDLTFCHVQRPGIISPVTFRGATGITINWTGDVRKPIPRWYFDVGKAVTWTLFSNQTDVDIARQNGINSEFLNIGFDERLYNPDGPMADVPEIVFLGNRHRIREFELSGQRMAMVDALRTRYGGRFRLYGTHWGRNVQSLMHMQDQEAAVYRGCKVAINQNHFNHDRFSSDRLLRAMGCGAYVVSNHYPNIELDFTPGKHLGAWKTFDDLFREIDWALEHEEERKKIAAEGCRLVHEKHTWAAKALELIKITGCCEVTGSEIGGGCQ